MQGSRTSLKMEFTRWRFTAPTRPHIHRFSVPSKDIDELPHSAYHKNQIKKPFLQPQPTNSIQNKIQRTSISFSDRKIGINPSNTTKFQKKRKKEKKKKNKRLCTVRNQPSIHTTEKQGETNARDYLK